MIPPSTVIEAVSRNPWTAIVFSSDGGVAEVVPFSETPTADGFLEFSRTHARGRRFRFVRQTRLDAAQLEALLLEARTPVPGAHSVTAPGQPIFEFEPRLHPNRKLRDLVDAISAWIVRRWG